MLIVSLPPLPPLHTDTHTHTQICIYFFGGGSGINYIELGTASVSALTMLSQLITRCPISMQTA